MLFKNAEGWGGKILSFFTKILPVRLLSGLAKMDLRKKSSRSENLQDFSIYLNPQSLGEKISLSYQDILAKTEKIKSLTLKALETES